MEIRVINFNLDEYTSKGKHNNENESHRKCPAYSHALIEQN